MRALWEDTVPHILSYLNDIEDHCNASLVNSAWKQASDNHYFWRSTCISMWNFPSVFGHLFTDLECRLTCLRLQSCFKQTSAKTLSDLLFVQDYFRYFRTLCGGGESESHDIAAQTLRPSLSLHREEEIDDTFQTSKTSKYFCHLDIWSIKANNIHFSYEEEDTEHELPKLWLKTLSHGMRCLSHDSLEDSNIPLVMEYTRLFISLLERASLRIEDDDDFVFIVHNALKRVNIFLQELASKGNYMMNYESKTRWRAFMTSLYKVWNQMTVFANALFLRLQVIAVEEFRTDFGETKSDTLQRIFDIYYVLNIPKSETVSGELDTHVLSRGRYACEALFKLYILTICPVLYGNAQLIEHVFDDTQKLDHFYKLIYALKTENIQMETICKESCPSSVIVRYFKSQMIQWFIELQILFTRVLQRLFTSYSTPNVEECRNRSNFVLYSSIPTELETIFQPYVETEEDFLRFSCFMQTHYENMFKIVQNMNSFIAPLMRDPKIKSSVNEYRKSENASQSPVQIYGTPLFAPSPSLAGDEVMQEPIPESSGWEDEDQVTSWEDDDDYSHERPKKRQRIE